MAWAGKGAGTWKPRFAGRAAALALSAAILLSPAAWASYKESYRKGIEAVDRREWTDAARWMRAAAGEQPREGEPVKIYGVRFEPYLPTYYLGLALFETGDCEGAVAAWQEAERQGAVQGSRRYQSLVAGRGTCRERLAARAPSTPPPRPAGPEPTELARAVPEPAEASARPARERRENEERRQQTDEAARAEAARVGPAERERAPAPGGRPAVRARGDSAPPAALRTAARAFFRADYRAVVRSLRAASFTEPRAAAAGNLLLAAARYALYLEGGEKDTRLRQQAIDHIRSCRKLNAKMSPDAKAFSPRFLAFFKAAE